MKLLKAKLTFEVPDTNMRDALMRLSIRLRQLSVDECLPVVVFDSAVDDNGGVKGGVFKDDLSITLSLESV